jgi:hypothetical protein
MTGNFEDIKGVIIETFTWLNVYSHNKGYYKIFRNHYCLNNYDFRVKTMSDSTWLPFVS